MRQACRCRPSHGSRRLSGPTFNSKLTNLWEFSDKYRNLYTGGGADALKQALGYTFFGDQNAIQYYVEVGFSGFEKVVNTLGGVTINVPAPVFDNGFPSNSRRLPCTCASSSPPAYST